MKTDKEMAVDIIVALINNHPTFMKENGNTVTILQPAAIPAILEKIYISISNLENNTKEIK